MPFYRPIFCCHYQADLIWPDSLFNHYLPHFFYLDFRILMGVLFPTVTPQPPHPPIPLSFLKPLPLNPNFNILFFQTFKVSKLQSCDRLPLACVHCKQLSSLIF
jgi:hypothetical protein